MATILEAIKSLFIDDSHKHGDGNVVSTESSRIVIAHTKNASEDDNRPATFVNSNYTSINQHLLDSGNDKYSAANVVTMPNPVGNTATKYSSESKDQLKVSEETSVIKKLLKKRSKFGHGRISGRR